MLRIELRSLELEDLVLNETGWAKALGVDLDPELGPEPLEIHCELSKCEDLVTAKGWVKGKMNLACDRCLKGFTTPYKSFFEVHYRPRPKEREPEGEVMLPPEDLETAYFDGETIELADQVRQTVLLSVPMRVLCRDDCRGLCGTCGRDLNTEKCSCGEPPADPRWSALKDWKPG